MAEVSAATRRRASSRRLASAGVLHTAMVEAWPMLEEHVELVRDYHGARCRAHLAGVPDEATTLLQLAAEAAMDQQRQAKRTVLLQMAEAAGAHGGSSRQVALVGRAVESVARRCLANETAMGAAWERVARSRALLDATAP
jgi:hypothetical protein